MSDMFTDYFADIPRLSAVSLSSAKKKLPQYGALVRQQAGLERESDLADVLRLTPQLDTIRKASERPEMGLMRDLLFRQISEQLGMGENLTPEQQRSMEQGLRSSQMARGMGLGAGAANREAVARALEGQKMLAQRQQQAMGLMSWEQSSKPDPFQIILGRGTPLTGQAASLLQGGESVANNAFFQQQGLSAQAAQAAFQNALQQQQIELARQQLNYAMGNNPYDYPGAGMG